MFDELFSIIEDRKREQPMGSYTRQLLIGGEDLILRKIGEEAMEVVLAATSETDMRLTEEIADLTYHLLVLLAQRGLSPTDVAEELARRALGNTAHPEERD